MTILLDGTRIVAVFPDGSRDIPQAAVVHDLPGHFVMPGLIDAHYHMMLGTRDSTEERLRLQFALLGGITSVRDMAGDAIALAELSRRSSGGAMAPRVFYSALLAGPDWFRDARAREISHGLPTGTVPWARAVVDSSNVGEVVAEARAAGATGIKVYANVSGPLLRRLAVEAHKQGLKVWSHATVFPAMPGDAVDAGVDVLSHSDAFVFELIRDSSRAYTTGYRGIDWAGLPPRAPQLRRVYEQMAARGLVLDPTLYTAIDNPGNDSTAARWRWVFETTRFAHELGVPIVAGTDPPERPRRRAFPNLHVELELLVDRAGLTPLEAMKAATATAANVLGVQDSLGTIRPGMVADLLVLTADPVADIRNTRQIAMVFKGGRRFPWRPTIMPDSS